MGEKKYRFDTLVVHLGNQPEKWQGSCQVPIYQSASYRFQRAEDLSEVFAGRKEGYIYQRISNPTSQVLEERLAGLEGGKKALVFSSGMSAITSTILSLVRSGDEIISGNSLFLSTYLFFTRFLPQVGVKVHLVETSDPKNFQEKINSRTRLIYLETIGNPKMDVPAQKEICQLARQEQVPVVVDNTLATPYLFRPIEAGANLVIHSTTKFLNGHGSAVGGVVIDGGNFDWSVKRFSDFAQAVADWGEMAFIEKLAHEVYTQLGTYQAPFHSFLTLLGVETLALRMERHLANAQKLAEYLETHPKVKWVNYPGLKSSAFHSVAREQFQGKGYGALLTFGLESQEKCFKFINQLKLCCQLANLGDAKTLVIHPYSTQYVSFAEEEKKQLGIKPEMVRVSVGIEAIEDIIEDFDQALAEV